MKSKHCSSLKAGIYVVTKQLGDWKEFPEEVRVTAVSDGDYVKFYHKGKVIWGCNAVYANYHYVFKPISVSR